MATGHSMASLHYEFLIGIRTSRGIHDTCRAILEVLKDLLMKNPSREDWLHITDVSLERSNFPHCLGTIDGKHIHIVKPIGCGTTFLNYKKLFFFLLLAVADANYCFTCIDIGSYGNLLLLGFCGKIDLSFHQTVLYQGQTTLTQTLL